jgi:hypothetical protein
MSADPFDLSPNDFRPSATRRVVACAVLVVGAAMALLALLAIPSALAAVDDEAAPTGVAAGTGAAVTDTALVGGTATDQAAAGDDTVGQLTQQIDAAGQPAPPAATLALIEGAGVPAAPGTDNGGALGQVPLVPFTDPKASPVAEGLQQGDGQGDGQDGEDGDGDERHTYDHPVEAAYRAEGAAWHGVQQQTDERARDAAKAAYQDKVLATDAAILEEQRHLAYAHGDPSDALGAEHDLVEFEDQKAELEAGTATIDPRGGRTALDASYVLRHTTDANQVPTSAAQAADDRVEQLDDEAAGARLYADTLETLAGQAAADQAPAAAIQARTVASQAAQADWTDSIEALDLAIAQRDQLLGFQSPVSDSVMRKQVQEDVRRAREAVEAPRPAAPPPEDPRLAGPAVDDQGHRLDLSTMWLTQRAQLEQERPGAADPLQSQSPTLDPNNQIGALEALADGQPLNAEQTARVLESTWLAELPKSPAEWQSRAKGMYGTELSALQFLQDVQVQLAAASVPGRVQGPFEPSVEELRQQYAWWAKEYRRTWLATDDAMANRELSSAWLGGDPSAVHAAEHDLRELHRRADALPAIALSTGAPLPDAPNDLRELDTPWLTTPPERRRPAPATLDADATQPRPVLLAIGGNEMSSATVEVELLEPADGEWRPFRSATIQPGGQLLLDTNEVKPGQRLRIRLTPGIGEGGQYGWVATRPDAKNPGGIETVISDQPEMIVTVPELPTAIRYPDVYANPEAVVLRPISGDEIEQRKQH